ncbi:hypothetical protein FRC01_008669, partial [Tulasnella sp. 417]
MSVEGQIQRNQTLSSISTYSTGHFSRLVRKISREEQPYHPLVTLFTYINTFFRLNFSGATMDEGSRGIDVKWEKAGDSKLGARKTDTPLSPESYLQRRFIITNKKEGVFSAYIKHDPQPLPSL